MAAGNPYWNICKLAMPMDVVTTTTAFVDAKAGKAMTRGGNAVMSTAQVMMGTHSAYFDGAADYVSTPFHADFLLGASDFTIEGWCWHIARPATNWHTFFSTVNGSTGYRLMVGTVGQIFFNAYVGGVSVGSTCSTMLTTGSWHHIAVCRASGTLRIFIDGVQANTDYTLGTVNAQSSTTYIGATDTSNWSFNGYIDDLFIYVGAGAGFRTAGFSAPELPSGTAMVQVGGTVRDSGTNLVSRVIHVHRRGDGALAGITNSTGGSFSISALDGTPHYAVALPVVSTDNAIILDNITPY